MNRYYSQMAERILRELREQMVKALKALAEFEHVSILPDYVNTINGYITGIEFDAETGKTLCVHHGSNGVSRVDIDDDMIISLDDIILLIGQLEEKMVHLNN